MSGLRCLLDAQERNQSFRAWRCAKWTRICLSAEAPFFWAEALLDKGDRRAPLGSQVQRRIIVCSINAEPRSPWHGDVFDVNRDETGLASITREGRGASAGRQPCGVFHSMRLRGPGWR